MPRSTATITEVEKLSTSTITDTSACAALAPTGPQARHWFFVPTDRFPGTGTAYQYRGTPAPENNPTTRIQVDCYISS